MLRRAFIDCRAMADIFISYTSSDRHEAAWVFEELETLGHTPHMHEGEIAAGASIYRWMEARHDAADHVLCVVSDAYLKAAYSTLERDAALWQAASQRPGFVLIVPVKPCRLPTLVDHYRRCKDLYDVPDAVARTRFREFMASVLASVAARPRGKLNERLVAVSNIPINVPLHFMGRDEPLAAIAAALARYEGRVAITALHGLRGVGKTTLAAAYAERHAADYRATWWIRAQTEATMRADLVALGVRLGWVEPDAKEEPALATVAERLRHEGEGVLLIYDNAIDAAGLKPYLPRGGGARVLVTSNAHNWRGLAEPVEIRLWPNTVGADYLVARTGREAERAAAEALSDALGGLPLAHEQAAAYCERLDVGLTEYARRFAATPAKYLDDARHAPKEHNDGLTVAKSFALAIEEAGKLHPAAEPLIVHAALLAPEQIPLYLFAEGREHLGEPLATLLADDGLDEAVAALRAFALVDREAIPDERNPAITTDTIRLHRLVREVAVAGITKASRQDPRRSLIRALTVIYPDDVFYRPAAWQRARHLDPLALALVAREFPSSCETEACRLLLRLASYRRFLADHASDRQLSERALAIAEEALGADHAITATALANLGSSLTMLSDLAGARLLCERALAIREKVLGLDHLLTAKILQQFASLLLLQGDFDGARPLYDRALAIRDRALGSGSPTAETLSSLGLLLTLQNDLAGARALYERALSIYEKVLGPDDLQITSTLSNLAFLNRVQGDHAAERRLYERDLAIHENLFGPDDLHIVSSLANLASLLQDQGDLAGALPLFERALAIHQTALGPDHPNTATSLANLALLLRDQGDLAGALPLFERALAIHQTALGPDHPNTATSLANLASLLQDQGDLAGARPLFERALAIRETVLRPDHPDTASSYSNLGRLVRETGDLARAELLFKKAIAIGDKTLGAEHSLKQRYRSHYARLLLDTGRAAAARDMGQAALAVHEAHNSPAHRWTKDSARVTADALEALGEAEKAAEVRARYGV